MFDVKIINALSAVLLLSIWCTGYSQNNFLTEDTTIAIPKLNFDSEGELIITASQTSSINDFDFLIGKWKMYNRKLNKRLENCNEWTEFESSDVNKNLLNGIVNMDIYSTEEMPGLEGKLFEGLTLRLFNPETKLWSLYWIPSNKGVMDPPVVGSFESGIGHFFTKDIYNGRNIIVMFRWDARDTERPLWGQAFTTDKGKTWEWNWFNVLERTE